VDILVDEGDDIGLGKLVLILKQGKIEYHFNQINLQKLNKKKILS